MSRVLIIKLIVQQVYLPYAAERRRTLRLTRYPAIVRLLRLAHLATAGATWAVPSWVLCTGWPELLGAARRALRLRIVATSGEARVGHLVVVYVICGRRAGRQR